MLSLQWIFFFYPGHNHKGWQQTEKRTMFLTYRSTLLNIASVRAIHPTEASRNTSLGRALNANTLLSHVEQAFFPYRFLYMTLGVHGLLLPSGDSEPRKVSFCTVSAKKRVLLIKDMSVPQWWWRWIETTMLGKTDLGRRGLRFSWVRQYRGKICWTDTGSNRASLTSGAKAAGGLLWSKHSPSWSVRAFKALVREDTRKMQQCYLGMPLQVSEPRWQKEDKYGSHLPCA